MKNVKNIFTKIFKSIPKEKLIIIICAVMSVITLIVSVIIFASAGTEEDTPNASISNIGVNIQNFGNFSPESPKSLAFQSLENNTCIVASIGAFSGEDLEIPEKSPYGETVVGIASRAFEGCEELVSIHIPATVTSIGDGVFKGCSSLAMITVDRANSQFSSVGGILYSKSKTLLVCYPAARIGNSYLLNLNVKTIADDAFYGVKHLSQINYEGTTSDFSKIAIGNGNRIFTTLPITCNYSPSK